MKCPHCGSHVQRNMDVCPHCSKHIAEAEQDAVSMAWCKSCGSSLPAGAQECPVCGMPVAGALGASWESGHGEDSTDEVTPAPELASALPPVPEPGGDAENSDAPTRMRLVILAAIAALVVIGGTALYITRPWNPNAYMIHATEEADTSQEGSLHSVSHLSGQDLIEDAERKEYLKNAEAKVDELFTLMGETDECCGRYEQEVNAFLESGELPEALRTDDLATYRDRLVGLYDEVSGFDMRGSSCEDFSKNELVVAQYLKGRVDTLYDVCETIEGATDAATATVAAEAKMAAGVEGRSLDEWRGLFENAYAGLGAQRG